MIRAGAFASLLLLSMAACRPSSVASEPAPGPAIALPAASARIDAVATPDAGPPAVAAFAHPPADARWVTRIPRSRRFRRLTLDGAGTVRLGWIRDAEHTVEGEGSARAVVRLVVERDGHAAAVSFGDLYGDVEPATLSYCARRGYRGPDGAPLETPRIDGFVSGASVGNSTGDEEILVLVSGSTLHVLDRQTSDGMCESETKQGPFTVCRGEEYVRTAEIRLATPPASLEESVAVTTASELGSMTTELLDCGAR